jgi:two-component system OmpR family sensor kinase
MDIDLEKGMKTELSETTYQSEAEEPEKVDPFIYMATHELRTPLTPIKGYVELIQRYLNKRLDDQELDELRSMFDAVARNTERLEKLIDDILEMRRIIDGRLKLSKSKNDVTEFLQQVAEDMKPVLDARGQHLRVESSVEPLVFGRQHISQVLQKLIQNASNFSPDGSTIWLKAERVDVGVRFSVTDEGMGLSKEDVAKLFKPFPKIDKPGPHQGTGLGLSICNGIVGLHDGEMWVESPGTGHGSTFFFIIPDSSE